MTAYYIDATAGSDSNGGTSQVDAKQTLGAGIALLSSPGDILYVKNNGSYVLTSTNTMNKIGTSTGGRYRIEGYTTTPGARDGRPTITSSTNSVILFSLTPSSYCDFVHLKLTHTAATRGAAFEANGGANSQNNRWIDCVIDGCANGIKGGTSAFTTNVIERCEIKNCTGSGCLVSGNYTGCWIHDNAGYGINVSYADFCIENCIISGNTNHGFYDSTGAGSSETMLISGNTFYNNNGDGIRQNSDYARMPWLIKNNVFYSNAGYGINLVNLNTSGKIDGCPRTIMYNAYGSNTSGATNGVESSETGAVTLTGDPFTNAGSGDFSLNNTAGAGAALRAAGFPGTMPGGTTTGYHDIGVAQHADPASSGTPVRVVIQNIGTY